MARKCDLTKLYSGLVKHKDTKRNQKYCLFLFYSLVKLLDFHVSLAPPILK